MNSVVTAVKGFGDSVKGLSDSVKHVTSSVNTNVSKNSEQIAQVIQWGNAVLGIRAQMKKQKAANTIYDDAATSNNRNI